MENLKLKDKPTFRDFQEYVEKLELQRGFSDQNAIEKCLLLGEEMGELFKAIRKVMKLKTDINSSIGSVKEEIADMLIYLCAIANRFGIDIEQAFREKEEINKKREWI
jgi:NTP pyrophosphatase (non-canonical NTP hydrolase)